MFELLLVCFPFLSLIAVAILLSILKTSPARCPACKGKLKDGAIKCIHCATDLPAHVTERKPIGKTKIPPKLALIIIGAIFGPMLLLCLITGLISAILHW